jgi:hypothetical protein
MITQSSRRQFFSIATMLVLTGLICTHLYFLIDAFLGAIILGIVSVKPIRFFKFINQYIHLIEILGHKINEKKG